MSASLVGSEMCIRDRPPSLGLASLGLPCGASGAPEGCLGAAALWLGEGGLLGGRARACGCS
eukprot:5528358-Alexandrium_andersonii.AAC.1